MKKEINDEPKFPARKIFSRGTILAIIGMLLLSLPFWVHAHLFIEQRSAMLTNSAETSAKIIAKTATPVSRSTSKNSILISHSNYYITYQFTATKNGKSTGLFASKSSLTATILKILVSVVRLPSNMSATTQKTTLSPTLKKAMATKHL